MNSLSIRAAALILLAIPAACRVGEAPRNSQADAPANAVAPAAPTSAPTPVAPAPPAPPSAPAPPPVPPAAGPMPVSEAPFSDKSAQGAANVVQTYFALVEERKYVEAWKLWPDGPRDRFAARFAPYRDYHAEVFAPGETEGAAGSIYVEVPARTYGLMKTGKAFDERVKVTLRRVNDVDGSTAEQRRWHIARIEPAAD